MADVIDEVPNPEVPNRPQAMVLEVREVLAGDVYLTGLRIEQDDGCDGFWYRKGDRVIAAIGRMPGIEPPFAGITNYNVAVWVLRDGAVDATIREVLIGGRRLETERELRAVLAGMPDTAVMVASASTRTSTPKPSAAWFAVLFGTLAVTLGVRGLRPRRP